MKKIVAFWVCVAGLFGTAAAQERYQPATGEQREAMIRNITEASAQLKTLRCEFVQTKTLSILAEQMQSEGVLFFKQKEQLRWEYTKPYRYEFVLNNGRILLRSEAAEQILEVQSSRLFREISNIIVSGINGSGIFDASKFTARFLTGPGDHLVVLVPKQKELQQLFHTIGIRFDRSDYTVHAVELEEPGGDKTFIEMKNKQINQEVSDELFTIH